MKKLMFIAVAAIASSVFAEEEKFEHPDLAAETEGFYDITLKTKHLDHARKTVSKSYKTVEAFDQAKAEAEALTGYELISVTTNFNKRTGDVSAIKFKYSYFNGGVGNFKTKVFSVSNKGVYDASTGKVYIWNTASNAKVSVTNGQEFAIISADKQKGYVAYEVPLAMHEQFVKTDDNKAAGGFTGGNAVAEDGTTLNFAGITAYGTGTFDSKNDYVKSVSGNVAGKCPNDLKFGCYGTWKLNKDAKVYGGREAIEDVLLKKGCVQLVPEMEQ